MRKLSLLFLFVSLSAGAWAGDVSEALAKLNANIDQVLGQFRDDLTTASLVFDDLAVDSVRATELKVHGQLGKIGPQNAVDLRLDNLEYSYGDGSIPTIRLQGRLGLDLTKFMRQEDLNSLFVDAERVLTDMAKSFTSDYGDAVEVSVVISDKTQDANGNYVSLRGKMNISVHLDKLPQNKNLKDVPHVSFMADMNLDVKTGLDLKLVFGMNKDYRLFNSDQKGLREFVEGLLNSDPKIMDSIGRIFYDLNGYATDIVNTKPN